MGVIGKQKVDATPEVRSGISPRWKESLGIPFDLDYVLLRGPKFRKSYGVAAEGG
jgi:hypothetical protein